MRWSVATVLVLVACTGRSTRDAGASTADAGHVAVDAGDLDSGPTDAATDADRFVPVADGGCGTLTRSGECTDAGVLRWCGDHGEVLESDCAARARTCDLQFNLGGYWCVGGLGSACDVNQTDVCESSVACELRVCGGPVDAGTVDAG